MSEGVHSVWLYADAAQDIFEHAKRRVYRLRRAGSAGGAGRKRKAGEEAAGVSAEGGEAGGAKRAPLELEPVRTPATARPPGGG